jgi:hypothetical protein
MTLTPMMLFVYADAGCTIQANTHSRYNEYVEMLKNSEFPILSFRLIQPNKTFEWTKKDVMDYFNITPDNPIYHYNQLIGGITMMIKTPYTERLINDYYNIAVTRPDLFVDGLGYPGFKEHRHDQSIFSIMRYLYGSVVVDDKTFPTDFHSFKSEPFIATRHRS